MSVQFDMTLKELFGK